MTDENKKSVGFPLFSIEYHLSKYNCVSFVVRKDSADVSWNFDNIKDAQIQINKLIDWYSGTEEYREDYKVAKQIQDSKENK